MVRPNSIEELCRILHTWHDEEKRNQSIDISGINSLVEHMPEDMTATVEGGMLLGEFQAKLQTQGQWLPVDLPYSENLSINELLKNNRSGPRRFGYGPIRDYVIGMRVAMADGTVIKAGGKVVKNVAGYDLCKLFIGSKGTLGIIVEATFKLRPLPETEVIIESNFNSIDELAAAVQAVRRMAIEPVVFDSHNLVGNFALVLAFAGAREDVEYQVNLMRELGFTETTGIEYDRAFWKNSPTARRASILPAETVNFLARITPSPYLARVGNGIVYYSGPQLEQGNKAPLELMRRVKQSYDPKGIFPEYSE
jgi:FAD/FMN-containing dehydrogenase